jgi:hypothetical protein
MKIAAIEIRVCKNRRSGLAEAGMRVSGGSELDFLVVAMKTDEGILGTAFGFAGRGRDGRRHRRFRREAFLPGARSSGALTSRDIVSREALSYGPDNFAKLARSADERR